VYCPPTRAARNPPFPTALEDHPVAHPNPGDFEPDGSLYSMRPFKGDLLVVEPNHGRLLRINISNWRGPKIEQLTDTSAVVGHVVPTSVAKRDDRFYVGNLGTFPIVVGSSKLYQITHEGFIIDYWAGFTTVVDIRVDAEGRICSGSHSTLRESHLWHRCHHRRSP
jgi:hypothetical protein